MFTNLHRSQHSLKRAEKSAAGEIRVAMVGNIGRMTARPVFHTETVPANGCEDTEVSGF